LIYQFFRGFFVADRYRVYCAVFVVLLLLECLLNLEQLFEFDNIIF